MRNEKLYQSMLNCDGTQKNCKECVFRSIPDCRNAMAHHAGALIQLQDVVIDNAGAAGMAKDRKISDLEREKKQIMQNWEQLNEAMVNLIFGLTEERHCASCGYSKERDNAEEEAYRQDVCKKCREEKSQYTLNLDYGKKPNPCENCIADSDECEGCEHNKDNE